MRISKKSANPFYALLVVVGLAFVVTAAAYGVMATREAHTATSGEATTEHPLMQWMRRNGNTALLIELAALGAFTVGAIATDDFWQRRAQRKQSPPT